MYITHSTFTDNEKNIINNTKFPVINYVYKVSDNSIMKKIIPLQPISLIDIFTTINLSFTLNLRTYSYQNFDTKHILTLKSLLNKSTV